MTTDKKTFQTHIESKIKALSIFYDRAFEYQTAKNDKRPKKNRWNEDKVQRTTDEMYNKLIQNIYEKVKSNVEDNGKQPDNQWFLYMEKHELYDSIEMSIYDIEFE
ncbi:TPA: hypothetical protein PF400_000490 [Staphylococcus aureus]|nr:hypothetical protein [Staphylococcus aureus]MBH4710961.1 hypothetical protein [Staphylococcus aureus]MBH4716300.1 hypothetical protein [Staphylococcus aureus]MBH4719673.1 hypothetical protein [Staphylococcus aureus]MBH4722035.1 hypothetical protein [Staphylococcus aureus]